MNFYAIEFFYCVGNIDYIGIGEWNEMVVPCSYNACIHILHRLMSGQGINRNSLIRLEQQLGIASHVTHFDRTLYQANADQLSVVTDGEVKLCP